MHVSGALSGIVESAEPEPEPVRAVFADLGLSEPILQAIAEMGYLHPTPDPGAGDPHRAPGA